jgi:hypothetical protein
VSVASDIHRCGASLWLIRTDEVNAMSSDQPNASDDLAKAQRQRRIRRIQLPMAAFAVFISIGSCSRVASHPRFETYHMLDVIQLITAGAGFGVALVLLVQFFGFSDSRFEGDKDARTPTS